MKKQLFQIGVAVLCGLTMNQRLVANDPSLPESDPLTFSPDQYTERTLTFPNGKTLRFRAYERMYYVSHIEDSTYQCMNLYVPETAYEQSDKTPILLRTYVGGYMAAKAVAPSATDATGRALAEGYVVAIPGSRGANSSVTQPDSSKLFTGKAPAGLLDLKAAIRYIRHFDATMPGDAEQIITDGTSAGGALSSLLGLTGNHPAYETYLQAMGAAQERDNVFASVCYCPIIDLDHADMAYEWLYSCTNTRARALSPEQIRISEELANQYMDYVESLDMRLPDGTPLDRTNYLDYMKSFLIQSAQRARNEGMDFTPEMGISRNQHKSPWGVFEGEFILDIDLNNYLNFIATHRKLKTPPAFDQQGVLVEEATPENQVFGDAQGHTVNFTDWSLQKATRNSKATLDASLRERVRIMNPMNFIHDAKATHATHWFIRHGARDRDTAFPVPVNLYTQLVQKGYQVNFALPWNRDHEGDYNLDDLFEWIHQTVGTRP
ncbi:MAG: subtype B tannase [Parabacteroides sp.]